MPDRPQSTQPPPAEQYTSAGRHPLRELFLVDLIPPLQETLHRVCCDLYQLAHEAGKPFLSDQTGDFAAELAAAVADLRFTAAALRYYQEPEVSELTYQDHRLCRLALATAPEVDRLAVRLEAAVAEIGATP